MRDGYLKHPFNWICPLCLYYKAKEKITGKSCDWDAYCTKSDEVKE